MKALPLLLTLGLTSTVGYAQNILEALKRQEDAFGPYTQGELMATDTLIDLGNGYYEEYMAASHGEKTILRQAAIFRNQSGTTTLAVTVTRWDFVCFQHETEFYKLSKAQDGIKDIPQEELLPVWELQEFLTDTVIEVLNRYLPEIEASYLEGPATIADVAAQIYSLRISPPREGTALSVSLAACDYIPTNEVSIAPEDWAIITDQVRTLEWAYDKAKQRFYRKDTD
ncbi:MAG TPA: hypothetical protein DCE41_29115 [Cytophagales bacterium]|nr:hypothetical protein [Cytophagales bacterium]HAA21599.1 hypothetical protein [Cytophagales bacterium]HAP62825.1 hypothetical protein [Cytophagales bacterium]